MNNLAEKLIENYERYPEKTILIQENRSLTYGDLLLRVTLFKNYLKSKGVKKGDKVLILEQMSIELYVTLLSLWSIGAIPCFMDAGFIKNNINKTEFDDISAIIGSTGYLLYSNVNKNLKKLKIKINSKVIEKLSKDKSLSSILGEEEFSIESLEDDFSAIYTYTSGSTGKPKVISRSHKFLLLQAEILAENLDYEQKDIELSTVPIFTLSNIYYGVTTVIAQMNYSNLEKTNPSIIVDQIEKYQINRFMCSPALLKIITDYSIKEDIKVPYYTKVFTGGGAVFISLINNIKRVFKDVNIYTLYGSSEAEPIAKLKATNLSEEDIKRTINGEGILAGDIIGVDSLETIETGIEEIGNISKEEFEKLKSNIGEIVVSGKNVLEGYVGGIGDSKNKFKVEGITYHRTGDIGCIDEKGRLWLRGRISNPYFNIEASLHAQFDIGKTAVIKKGEDLILVLETTDEIDEDRIKEAISFEKIKKIVYVTNIPVDKRHGSKVDYNALKKDLEYSHII